MPWWGWVLIGVAGWCFLGLVAFGTLWVLEDAEVVPHEGVRRSLLDVSSRLVPLLMLPFFAVVVIGWVVENRKTLPTVLWRGFFRADPVGALNALVARGELEIGWIAVPDHSSWIGKTVAECGFRATNGVTVIAILREPEPVSGSELERPIKRGDTLAAVGSPEEVSGFRKSAARGGSRL